MATIKQIDHQTVHRIQSGQVIVDLCSVVKELVENSVDSGATSIDVRFKNQGLDSIEVQDNGSGIAPSNYASVALKHHTSKLSSYSDIASLHTFGFRGEALASLCALSHLTVVTCLEKDAPKGSKLSFDHSGELRATNVVAAQRGTTVSVEGLFFNLPVRRRELERNVKREYQKVIALLNQYACIQTELKFSVSQQPTKGKRILLFSTKGNLTTRENIMNIFGAKTLQALVPLDLHLKLDPSKLDPSHTGPGLQELPSSEKASDDVHVVGHVSRPAYGEGRQTPDRQMFFVNGRPCGLPQFAKAFNEVYKSYNSSQSPFILADVRLDTHMYDVNVSPDKRSILLHNQHLLLDTLRNSLITLFNSFNHEIHIPRSRNAEVSVNSRVQQVAESSTSTMEPTSSTSKRSPGVSSDSEDDAGEDRIRNKHDHSGRQRTKVMSSRLLAREGRHQNLISQWIRRDDYSVSGARSQSPCSSLEVRSQESAEEARTEEDEDEEEVESGKKSPVEVVQIERASTGPIVSKHAPGDSVQEVRGEDVELPTPNMGQVQVHRSDWPSKSDRNSTSVNSSPPARETITKVVHSPPMVRNASASPLTMSLAHGITASSKAPPLDFADEQESGSRPVKRRRIAQTQNLGKEDQPSFGNKLFNMFSAPNPDETQDFDSSEASENSESRVEARDEISDGDSASDRHHSPIQSVQSSVGSMRSREGSMSSPVASHSVTLDRQLHTTGDSMHDVGSVDFRVQSLQGLSRRKDVTTHFSVNVDFNEQAVKSGMTSWLAQTKPTDSQVSDSMNVEDISAPDAESKLPLIISRTDFGAMRIAGQFNLGFIIAIRQAATSVGSPPASTGDTTTNPTELQQTQKHDELFIIDQHASDEKYNFERLQNSHVVQSQRLVHPKQLELTALEEEIVAQQVKAIESNGFKIHVDMSGEMPVGLRCQLTALPLSRETTFELTDLEELISLLADQSSESLHVPRPAKVRKMFAMRACRSSIMIGKALTERQMHGLVKHMGEMDKPWNCPHGRPTMRHLCRLQAWDDKVWTGDSQDCAIAAWRSFVGGH